MTFAIRVGRLNRYRPHCLENRYKTGIENRLTAAYPTLERKCRNEIDNENIDAVVRELDISIASIYRESRIKKADVTPASVDTMKEANMNFENLRKCITGEVIDDFDEVLTRYKVSRNNVSQETLKTENEKWNKITNENDSKKLWNKIDWKGDVSKTVSQPPVFEELTTFFEDLYKNDKDDIDKIDELRSDVYDPLLDDPVTKEEMDNAMDKMKNGGYDHRIEMFRIMVRVMSPLILLILNSLFFVAYPDKMAISLLTAIPKKGDLSLVTNYRGIQMLPALAVLHDRVIANRLTSWIKVHDEQSAFQKKKSTIHQLFTIRLLIELAKKNNFTLYIGLFDLAKAFDKVSRYRMLKKLIAKGIGNCMLQALKRLYSCTYCVLSCGNQQSEKFRTYSGIRQGAASSTLLFIAFIDDLIDYLEERCPSEPFLDILHCLLHADDTAIVSTNRTDFVNKCNHMIKFFDENDLKLNFSKCEYLIINGKGDDVKEALQLSNGLLSYKSVVKYLGMKISDTGNISGDIDRNIDAKRSSVTIKFGNFCRKNFLAPLDVKLNVLNTCASASLTYGCEVWGGAKIPKLEALYRQGLKTALSVSNNVNNEIVYFETGAWPLQIRISKQQLKFWMSIEDLLQNKPDHYISKLVTAAADCKYIKYYKQLHQTFTDTGECDRVMTSNVKSALEAKTRMAGENDRDSRLGTYMTINPTLTKPSYPGKLEFQRVCITRYRSGSHNLRIETGRTPYIPREDRLCRCNTGIQTIEHVFLHCPLLVGTREKYSVVDVENGVMNENFLVEMEHTLGIK